VADLLREFRARRPEVTVALRELDFAGHFSALPERAVDVQLVRLPYGPVPGVAVELLCTEPRMVALPAAHPLLDRPPEQPLTAVELAGLPFFRLAPNVPADWAAHFAPWGSAPSAPEVGTAAEVLQLVAAGAGVALVPRSLGRRVSRPDVAFRDADVAPSRLAVAWRPGHPGDVAAALARQLAGALPATV
jgi:DNA-binding transcriptional LysR family regulator